MDRILRKAIDDMKVELKKKGKERVVEQIKKDDIKSSDITTNAPANLIQILDYAQMHLAMEPRIVEYEITEYITGEYFEEAVVDLFENATFSRPWIMHLSQNREIITCLHFLDDESGDVFLFYKLIEEKHFGITLAAALSREDHQITVAVDSMSANGDILFDVLSIWQLMTNEKEKYIEIKSNKTKKKKGQRFASANKPLIQYITLTEIGKHYINNRKGTGNNNFTKGKIQLDTHVGGFKRKYWIGHGADKHQEQLDVRGHNRKQWVLPVDKVVKIKKADADIPEDSVAKP